MTTPAAPATTTDPATPATPTPAPATPATPPAATTAPAATTPEETPEQKIQRLEAEIKKATTAAKTAEDKARVNAKTAAAEEAKAELAQQFGKILGLVADEPIDPAKLTEQLSAATADAKKNAVALAVYHAASAAGADAAALLDSVTFTNKLANIDPTDATAVTAAITEAVQANASFAATTTPRIPAPNPALGSSAAGAPDAQALIAKARADGDWKTVIALENQKLLQPPAR